MDRSQSTPRQVTPEEQARGWMQLHCGCDHAYVWKAEVVRR